MFILTHNPKSLGAKRLGKSLDAVVVPIEKITRIPIKSTVVNWGCGDVDRDDIGWLDHCERIINHPSVVLRSSNKLSLLSLLRDTKKVSIPKITSDYKEACKWAEKSQVVCRTLLRSSEGKGIVIADKPQDVVDAPLYTLYMKKKDEYRLHFARKLIKDEPVLFHQQRKYKRKEVDNPNWMVRNYRNGFSFQVHDVFPPDDVIEQAKLAVYYSGLHFGAVDVIWNETSEKAYVLEINTAPGLEGTSVERYANIFGDYYG